VRRKRIGGGDDDAIDAAFHSHANAWGLPESLPYSSSDFGTERRSLMPNVQRGKYMGVRLGEGPASEAEHFIRCPACNGWIDCRDLGQAFEHEGPLPHPVQDQPQ
jgi:hypothetical protein